MKLSFHRWSKRSLPWVAVLGWTFPLGCPGGLLAAGTNEPPALDAKSMARRVADWNIFDPDRQPRTRSDSRPAPKPRPVVAADAAEMGLVGVMDYTRGTFAFFDGNAPEYRKTLQLRAEIAGHTLTAITPQSVTLTESNRPPVRLKVGQRMRRDSEGVWQVVSGAAGEGFSRTGNPGNAGSSGGSTGASGASASSTPSGEDPPGSDEILKRLLKKREQEMK